MPALRLEAFSLMRVVVSDEAIVMSKKEIHAVIEATTGRRLTNWDMSRLPGTEAPSIFEQYFKDEDETEDEP